MNLGLVYQWESEHIFSAGGIHWVHAQTAPQVPGAHLSAVVIAAEAIRTILVNTVRYDLQPFRCFLGVTERGVHVNDVVTGFVSVCVLSDESGYIDGYIIAMQFRWGGEQLIQFGY